MGRLRGAFALLISTILIFSLSGSAEQAIIGQDIMAAWTEDEVGQILQETRGKAFFPAISDRTSWDIFESRFGSSWFAGLVLEASSSVSEKLPLLPASLFLEYQNTGQRVNYEEKYSALRAYFGIFSVAECYQNRGKFLDPLVDRVWRICELSSWEYPAHATGLPYPGAYDIDLGAAEVARELSFIAYELDGVLPAAVKERIYQEVKTRVFKPFISSQSFSWENANHNWNAVCGGGIISAAVALEPMMRLHGEQDMLPKLITRAQNSLRYYLSGFGVDGGTTEGIGYWRYGFESYARAGFVLSLRTQNRLNLFEGEKVKKIALFPVYSQLSPKIYPSFSDSSSEFSYRRWLGFWLAKVLNEPLIARTALEQGVSKPEYPDGLDTSLLNFLIDEDDVPIAARRDLPISSYYAGVQWMIARNQPGDPDGLVLAAKAGHNNENHNHNDVGSFIVHWRRESLLVDPGKPVFDRDFFGDTRYETFAASSRGHSVPVAAGLFQGQGREYAARITEQISWPESDRFGMGIEAAYPDEAKLERLDRRFQMHREGDGIITITDQFEFQTEAATFDETLITFAEVQPMGPGWIRLIGNNGALDVHYEPKDMTLTVESFSAKDLNFDVEEETIRRVLLSTKNRQLEVRLEIIPVP